MTVKLKLLKSPTAEAKIPPQYRMLLAIMEDQYGIGTEIDRQALVDVLVEGGLTTVQKPSQILAYYLPRMKEDGFVQLVASADEDEEKPAKEKKVRAAKAPRKTKAKPQPEAESEDEVETEDEADAA